MESSDGINVEGKSVGNVVGKAIVSLAVDDGWTLDKS